MGLVGKAGLGNCGKWGPINFGFIVFFVLSCFTARLVVIIEENIRAMRREATKKNFDEAIVLEKSSSIN